MERCGESRARRSIRAAFGCSTAGCDRATSIPQLSGFPQEARLELEESGLADWLPPFRPGQWPDAAPKTSAPPLEPHAPLEVIVFPLDRPEPDPIASPDAVEP